MFDKLKQQPLIGLALAAGLIVAFGVMGYRAHIEKTVASKPVTLALDFSKATPIEAVSRTAPPSQPPEFTGPFGLSAGMSREQVVLRIGRSFIVNESENDVVFNTAPIPNDHFSSYRCFFAKNGRLAAVIASSSPVVIPRVHGFLSTYEFLKIDLENKYGKSNGEIPYRGSKKEWDIRLRSHKPVASVIWDQPNDKLYLSHLWGIALGVKPIDKERGVLTLAYDFNVSEEPGL